MAKYSILGGFLAKECCMPSSTPEDLNYEPEDEDEPVKPVRVCLLPVLLLCFSSVVLQTKYHKIDQDV